MEAWNQRNSRQYGCTPEFVSTIDWFKHDAPGRCQFGFERRDCNFFHQWGKTVLQLTEEWHSKFYCAMLVKSGAVACALFASPITLSLQGNVGITVERCWTQIWNKKLQLWHWTVVSDETRTTATRWTHWHLPPKIQSNQFQHMFFLTGCRQKPSHFWIEKNCFDCCPCFFSRTFFGIVLVPVYKRMPFFWTNRDWE